MTFEKVIIELGGNPAGRTPKAIELAVQMPDAFLFFSTVEDPALCVNLCKENGISPDRYYLDYLAWDTVTNFTTSVNRILSYGCKELYIVTDGFHMRRSMSIATAVYFKKGVKLVPSQSSPADHQESKELVILDTARAWLYRFTNQILADQTVYDDRMPLYQEYYCQARQLQK
jgi:uncharacterized SAM-binding protein YcdF (DUF218 family)